LRYCIPKTVRFPGYTAKVVLLNDEDFEEEFGSACLASWVVEERTIYLRVNRNRKQRLADFAHEMGHCFMDWQEAVLGSKDSDPKT
jgi:hypothetical protein